MAVVEDQFASDWAALYLVVIIAILIDELTSDWASTDLFGALMGVIIIVLVE